MPTRGQRRSTPARRGRGSKRDGDGAGARFLRWRPGPEGVRRTTTAVAWITVVGLLGWGMVSGVPELERRAAARDLAGLEASGMLAIDFLGEPDWFRSDPDLRPRLEGLLRQAIGRDRATTTDRSGLQAGLDALQRSGWFQTVRQVRWTGTGRVEVDAEWVVPAVVVRGEVHGRRVDVLVDRRGVRLPYEFEEGTARSLPVLLEPALASAPAPGESWGDDVEAGIALHALLQSHSWYDQIRSVDLSNHRDDLGLVLKTDDCDLVWGLEPGSNSLAEPPAEDKVRYLDWLVAEYGRIDAHCLGGTINLPADVVTYRPPGP